jgi:Na+-driven multidrug efflux pump
MKYVAAAGVINVGLDLLLIGPAGMGAAGAALATVLSQAISDILAVRALFRMKDIVPARRDIHFDRDIFPDILRIGVPVALQEGVIQISFLAITAIANGRGLEVSAAVGVVEKIISFLFLVPSAMLSTVSAVAAQNAGAGQHERSRQALFTSILFCCIYGACVFVLCQFVSEQLVSLFLHDDPVAVTLGGQYLRSYSLDTLFAGIQFCFSGFFSAYGKAFYSFIHNLISILLVRIPGAALASRYFPDTLYPMGLAAPLGSLLSSVICVFLYIRGRRFWIPAAQEQEEHRSSSF